MSKPIAISALVVAGTFVAAFLVQNRQWESAEDRAHRLCSDCGLLTDEIDVLIDQFRGVERLWAEESFYATFDSREGAELCQPCAYAILDAAGAEADDEH